MSTALLSRSLCAAATIGLVSAVLGACEAPVPIKPPEELPVERPGQQRPPPAPGIR